MWPLFSGSSNSMRAVPSASANLDFFDIPEIWQDNSNHDCSRRNQRRAQTTQRALLKMKEVSEQLLLAYSASPQKQATEIASAFKIFKEYTNNPQTIEELITQDPIACLISRQYAEQEDDLQIEKQLHQLFQATGSAESQLPSIYYFAIGSAFPSSLLIETQIQTRATELNDIEEKITATNLAIEKKFQLVLDELKGLPRDLIQAIKTYHQQTIEKINQATNSRRDLPKYFYSLTHLLTLITEHYQFSSQQQNQIDTTLVFIEDLDQEINEYLALQKNKSSKLADTEKFLEQQDPYFILYIVTKNKAITQFLNNSYFSLWKEYLIDFLLSEKSHPDFHYMTQDGIDPLKYAIALVNLQLSQLLSLNLEKLSVEEQQNYEEISKLAATAEQNAFDEINLQHIINIHEKHRQSLAENPNLLDFDFIDKFSPFTKEITALHGTPALLDICINNLSFAYSVAKQMAEASNQETKEKFQQYCLLFMFNALYNLFLAENREEKSLAAINNLTMGKSLPSFFKKYIPTPPDVLAASQEAKIKNWRDAENHITKQIKLLANEMTTEDLDFTVQHLRTKAAFSLSP